MKRLRFFYLVSLVVWGGGYSFLVSAQETEERICAGSRICEAKAGTLIETDDPGRSCDPTKPINQFTPPNHPIRMNPNGAWFICSFVGPEKR